MLLDLQDFHGWDLGAAWENLALGIRHYGQFERCAIVGDRGWQRWMIALAKPFFRVEYFDRSQEEEAWRWIRQPVTQMQPGLLEQASAMVRQHPVLTLGLAAGLAVFFISRAAAARKAF